MKPFFSIIIPVYNTEKYLSKCINSVLHQTNTDYEIIIIDDGSTDQSPIILDKYSEEYKNIKVIHQNNKGLGLARNTGLLNASGEYVVFLDSDDYLENNCLNILFKKAKVIKADIIIFNMRKVSEKTHLILEESFLNLKDEVIDLKEMNLNTYFKNYFFPYIHGHEACNKIYRLEFLKNNNLYFEDNNIICSEDLLFNLKLLPHVTKICSINKSLYNYLQRENSLMNTVYRENLCDRFINLLSSFDDYLLTIENINSIEKEIAILNFNLLVACLYNEKNKYGNSIFKYKTIINNFRKKSNNFNQRMLLIAYSNYCEELLISQNIKKKTAIIMRILCFCIFISPFLGSILYWLINLRRKKC